ncbi:MAG: hypothetical protein AAGN82_09285 [Myxococcota bacterium]
MAILDHLRTLLSALETAASDDIPAVTLRLDGGDRIDVFRAEPVPSRPAAWRIRGIADGDDPEVPIEVRAVLLGTTDGRAMLVRDIDRAPGGGDVIVEAVASTRPSGDLAALIAHAVRRRFE